MGLIDMGLGMVFGNGRNALRETAEVFRPNAEAGAQRDHEALANALAQFGAEFRDHRTGFDRVMDALNRLPRPAMAFGAIGLMGAAMTDPEWFAARMQGLALVPEALWWLIGAVVSFYFGARHQSKGQDFQREIAQVMSRVPEVTRNVEALRRVPQPEAQPASLTGTAHAQGPVLAPASSPRPEQPALAARRQQAPVAERNPALDDWWAGLN